MKKIIALILVIVLSLCLCACGGSKSMDDMIAKYKPYASAKDALKTYGKPDTVADEGYPEEMLARFSKEFLMLNAETYKGISCDGVELEMRLMSSKLSEEIGFDRLFFVYPQEGDGPYTQAEIDAAAAACETLLAHLKERYGECEIKTFEDENGGYSTLYLFYTTAKDGTKLGIRLADNSTESGLQGEEGGNHRYYGLVNIYCIPDME